MGVVFQYPMSTGTGMGTIFENGYGYDSTRPIAIPTNHRCFLSFEAVSDSGAKHQDLLHCAHWQGENLHCSTAFYEQPFFNGVVPWKQVERAHFWAGCSAVTTRDFLSGNPNISPTGKSDSHWKSPLEHSNMFSLSYPKLLGIKLTVGRSSPLGIKWGHLRYDHRRRNQCLNGQSQAW